MQLELGEHIGSGGISDVYEYGKDRVIKLYKLGFDSANYEYAKTLTAYENGLPTPRIYDIIDYNGRRGIIMERVKGESLLSIMLSHISECYKNGISYTETFFSPKNIRTIELTVKTLLNLHLKTCHSIESAQTSLKNSCKYNRYLTENEKLIVNTLIDDLPVSDNICHGDPNPGNFILSNDQIFLIDWNNCVRAHPLFDVAEYSLMMKYSDVSIELPEYIVNYLREYKDEYVRVFIDLYIKASNLDISSLDIWIIPLLVSKMGGNNTVEKQQALLADIRNRLRTL